MNGDETTFKHKPKNLPFGLKQLKHSCPLCKSTLFFSDGVVKCSSCSLRKGKKLKVLLKLES